MRTTPDDLATPARIRHAAILCFGRDGFGVGLRTIAEEAGVSLGLIRHHFGSKSGLRDACDDQVLREIREAKEEQFLAGDPGATMLRNLATVERFAPVMGYLMQALREGGGLAGRFVDRMVADAEAYSQLAVDQGVIRPSRDPAGRAYFLTVALLGGALVTQALTGERDPQQSMRHWMDAMTLPALELYTEGLLTDDTLLTSYLGYQRGRDSPPDPEQPEQPRQPGQPG